MEKSLKTDAKNRSWSITNKDRHENRSRRNEDRGDEGNQEQVKIEMATGLQKMEINQELQKVDKVTG